MTATAHGQAPTAIGSSTLPASASTTVTERRVYRRKWGTETWFEVGDLLDNTSTDFTDSKELPQSDILEAPLGIFVLNRRLVRRKPHPTDRRAKLVELTSSGREAAARADAILDEPPAALHDLPDADLQAVLRVLEHLAGP